MEGQPAGLITAVDITERKLADATEQAGGLRDPLTGLLSNAQLRIAFTAETKRSQRSGRSFGFLLLKIEGLAEIAKQGGAMAGSRALCKVSRSIGAICRTADVAARFGDDEFALVLPETSLAGVRRVAARIEEKIMSESLDFPMNLTAGTAVFPQDGPTIEHLLNSARMAYAKKEDHTAGNLAMSA